MSLRTYIQAFSFLVLAAVSRSQETPIDTPAIEVAGLTHEQLVRQIFEGERTMIANLRSATPIIETYLQSLSPNAKGERPIDDAYFLSKVDFANGYKSSGEGRPGHQTVLFGGSDSNRKVRVNNGRKWGLNPDGCLDMLFVDIENFDADTYDLKYLQKDTWNDNQYLLLSVIPKMPRLQGQFKGQIWVDSTAFKITRIKGTFTPPSVKLFRRIVGGNIPMYFSFESFRQEVTPTRWLPSYTYFDENRTWQQINHNGETDFHYRGHIFIWGYRNIAKKYSTPDQESDFVTRLEKDKFLANPGTVERDLNEIVRRIVTANKLTFSDLKCRVLLTTPVEILHAGHTIILSRGLLNIVPHDSVIPILLAREIAEIELQRAAADQPTTQGQRFREEQEASSFQQPSGYRSLQSDAAAWRMGINFVDKAGFSKGMSYTSSLSTQLLAHSKQVPNLTRPRFGRSLLDILSAMPTLGVTPRPAISATSLTLRGKYTVDTWNATLNVRDEIESSTTARNKPAL